MYTSFLLQINTNEGFDKNKNASLRIHIMRAHVSFGKKVEHQTTLRSDGVVWIITDFCCSNPYNPNGWINVF